jgi:hypothetical protein
MKKPTETFKQTKNGEVPRFFAVMALRLDVFVAPRPKTSSQVFVLNNFYNKYQNRKSKRGCDNVTVFSKEKRE